MAIAKKATKAKTPARKTPARKAAAKAMASQPAPRARVRTAPIAPAPKAASPSPGARPLKVAKSEKVKKSKQVRDSFTLPKAEYAVLEALKLRAAMAGSPAKKSELLRAGITALATMGDGAFSAALRAVPAIKTGRPAKS